MAVKIMIGLALHLPYVTDFNGLSIYGLKAKVKDMNIPPTFLMGYGTLYVCPSDCGGTMFVC